MTIEFPVFGFINLFASFHAMLVGLALLKRGHSRDIQLRRRFSAMLICIGYLLGVFTLSHYDYLAYAGVLKISHDLAALLLGGLIFEYVRCCLGARKLSALAYAPVLAYLSALIVKGQEFYLRIEIHHLSAIVVAYSLLALVSYLWHIAQRLFNGAETKRIASIELFFYAFALVYTLKLIYALNSNYSLLLMAAPLAGAVILSLFFLFYLFSPRSSEYFVNTIAFRSKAQKSSQLDRIIQCMIRDEPYLDAQLSISALAQKLGYRGRELSEIINCESGKSFYQFVNGFRIAKAKTLLSSESERHTSIEAIGLICGFKSRSTFYQAFRRETGQTPGEYRDLHE